MRLLNPWALIGLAAVAAPVVAHLLARRPARRLPFPSLRFLPASTPRPVSRDRLTDLGLLALRSVIVAAAALALAQPLWLSADGARDLGNQIARAIIVDTSASMARPVTAEPGAARAIDRARALAADFAATATSARIVETAAPATLVAGAQAWLAAQPMRRELVVVSDFQTGAMDREHLAGVASGTGIDLVEVPATGSVPAASSPDSSQLVLLTGDSERAAAQAARAAAISQGAPAEVSGVAIMFPEFPSRAQLLRESQPLQQAASFRVLERVVRDPLVIEARARESAPGSIPVSAVVAQIDGESRVVFDLGVPPHSLLAAAVIRAVSFAAGAAPAGSEAATTFMTAAERETLERPADESGPGEPGSQSHGRWIWLVVLALLGVELMVRRNRKAGNSTEAHARVA